MHHQSSSVPAFLSKLRLLVDDSKTDAFIYWDPSGKSFHIRDGNRLAKDVLPMLFKHNNLSSFIRQLNMYGFRKVNRAETYVGFSSDSENMEFCHPYFIRDDESLMNKIQRKHPNYGFPTSMLSQNVRTGDAVTLNGTRENSSVNHPGRYAFSSDFNQLAEVVRQLKLRQEATNQQFTLLRQENQFLHRQINSLRTQIERQGNLIQTLFNVLSAFTMDTRGNKIRLCPAKRKLAITGAPTSGEVEYNIDPKTITEGRRILASNPHFAQLFFPQGGSGSPEVFSPCNSSVVEMVPSSSTSSGALPQPRILAIQDVPAHTTNKSTQSGPSNTNNSVLQTEDDFRSSKHSEDVSIDQDFIDSDDPLSCIGITSSKAVEEDAQNFGYPFDPLDKFSPSYRLSDIEPSISNVFEPFSMFDQDSSAFQSPQHSQTSTNGNDKQHVHADSSFMPKKRRVIAYRSLPSQSGSHRVQTIPRSRRRKGTTPLFFPQNVNTNNSTSPDDPPDSFTWNHSSDQVDDGPLMNDVPMNAVATGTVTEDGAVDELENDNDNDATLNDVVNDFLLGPNDQHIFDGLFSASPLRSIGNSPLPPHHHDDTIPDSH
nr:heat shock transcription factor [Hymenolepis microstoma]